jgi:hypothetical protein
MVPCSSSTGGSADRHVGSFTPARPTAGSETVAAVVGAGEVGVDGAGVGVAGGDGVGVVVGVTGLSVARPAVVVAVDVSGPTLEPVGRDSP